MPWHNVAQGEWIAQIAQKYGFADPSVIHDHADNADLKKKRPDPNLLLPGDRLFIPDMDEKEVEVPAGKMHRFKVKVPKVKVRIIIHDEDDQPLANQAYKLTLDRNVFEGTSAGDGLIEAKVPAVQVSAGVLEINGYVIPIRLGHLDPLDEVSGVQGRLHNLGYDCGPIDGRMSDTLTEMLKRFQTRMGLTATGAIDDATKGKLQEACGC